MLNIKTYTSGGTVTITDMINAGRRGKTCGVVRFNGWRNSSPSDGSNADKCNQLTDDVLYLCEQEKEIQTLTLDQWYNRITAMIAAYGLVDGCGIGVYRDEIKGIHAPKETLTAGLPGKWSAFVGNDGITINDEVDRLNEPCMIDSTDQSRATVYAKAAKVWDQVKECKTFSEVGNVLRNAGIKLHYFCRMD